jgi:hypothetical protein
MVREKLVYVNVKMPAAMKQWLKKRAEAEYRETANNGTITAQVLRLIAADMKSKTKVGRVKREV